jgi:hypothetical protein
MTGEHRTDELRRHPVRPHRGVQGKPVKQSVQALGLELEVEPWTKTSVAAQLLERRNTGHSKFLVDLHVASAQLRID